MRWPRFGRPLDLLEAPSHLTLERRRHWCATLKIPDGGCYGLVGSGRKNIKSPCHGLLRGVETTPRLPAQQSPTERPELQPRADLASCLVREEVFQICRDRRLPGSSVSRDVDSLHVVPSAQRLCASAAATTSRSIGSHRGNHPSPEASPTTLFRRVRAALVLEKAVRSDKQF